MYKLWHNMEDRKRYISTFLEVSNMLIPFVVSALITSILSNWFIW